MHRTVGVEGGDGGPRSLRMLKDAKGLNVKGHDREEDCIRKQSPSESHNFTVYS